MRRSFEEKLRTFSQAQNQFEQEKKVALEELKAQHRQEIQELLRSHQSQNANYSKDQEKLGQLHKAEVTTITTAGSGAALNHHREKVMHKFFDCSKHELSFSHCAGVSQVDSLTERVEELKQDKKRLVEEYEAKLSKVQCCGHNQGKLHEVNLHLHF